MHGDLLHRFAVALPTVNHSKTCKDSPPEVIYETETHNKKLALPFFLINIEAKTTNFELFSKATY